MGTTSAAVVVANMHRSFPFVENCLMVGIGGGAPLLPQNDIRLGDVVVGIPKGNYGGILPYLFGKTMQEGKFVQTGRYLNGPPTLFLNAISKLRSERDSGIHTILADALSKEPVSGKFARPGVDHLYEMDYDHLDETKSCSDCDSSKLVTRPVRDEGQHQSYIHYGLIASGDQVMRHGKTRDKLSREQDVLCFEMEAEGIVNTLPFLVIRGICDYADSHKNKIWQPYAALVAAAFSKALMLCLPVRDSNGGSRTSKIRISLPVAKGATFGSFGTEGEPMCLEHTRENLLRIITDWANASDTQTTKQIFWLSGGAGTGKSTIARTVAKFLKDQDLLGGSFFFRRGTEDCSRAERFITTLAADLRFHVRGVSAGISKALRKDPRITEKDLGEQFEQFIQKPLMEAKPIRRTTLVIDALDECENENHVLAIVRFLALLTDIDNSITVFITSRGETFINDIFKALPQVVQKRVLHDVEELEIESDIKVFFQHELATIRTKRGLPGDWPTSTGIESLVKIASPLFIVAANICRYLDDWRFRPDVQLSYLLGCESGPIVMEANPDKSLQWTYRHILAQSLVGTTGFQRATIIREFKEIIGIVVLLEQPLSLPCLSRFIYKDEKDVQTRLEGFQSVLHIPTHPDGPIRTLHLSFREFLLDVDTKTNNPFWLDEREIHRNIAQNCIKIMRNRLRKNICRIRSPGVLRSEVSSSVTSQTLTADIAYACRYWVTHLVKAREELQDKGQIHQFLQNYSLEWLEATSFLDLYPNNIYAITALRSILSAHEATELGAYLHDFGRFIQYNTDIITKAPLQVYHSALLWSPTESLVRKQFFGTYLRWVKIAPIVGKDWEPWVHIFQDGKYASIIKFSPDSESIATYTYSPKCITIRDCISGALKQKVNLDGYEGENIEAMEFLPDGRSLAIVADKKVDILDLASGKRLGGFDTIDNRILQLRPKSYVPGLLRDQFVRLSLDGRFAIVAGADNVVRKWSIDSREVVESFDFPVLRITGLEISPNLEFIVTFSYPSILSLQNTRSRTFFKKGQGDFIQPGASPAGLKFSPDSRYLVYATRGSKGNPKYFLVSHRLDSKLGLQEQRSFEPKTYPMVLEFVSNEQIAIPGLEHGSIEIWDLDTGTEIRRFFAHRSEEILSIVASPNHGLLAASGRQTGVRLRNFSPQELVLNAKAGIASSADRSGDLGSNSGLDQNFNQNSDMIRVSFKLESVQWIYPSPDGKTIAICLLPRLQRWRMAFLNISSEGNITLKRPPQHNLYGTVTRRFEPNIMPFNVCFSPDSKTFITIERSSEAPEGEFNAKEWENPEKYSNVIRFQDYDATPKNNDTLPTSLVSWVILIFDTRNLKKSPIRQEFQIQGMETVRGVSFSSEGDLLAVQFYSHTPGKFNTHVWETDSWSKVLVIKEPVPQLSPKTAYPPNTEGEATYRVKTRLGLASFNFLSREDRYNNPGCELDLENGWVIRKQTKDKILCIPADLNSTMTNTFWPSLGHIAIWKSSFAYMLHNHLHLLELDLQLYDAEISI
ncbi:hypothetical protein TWF594_009431 [Orbilia oligospora]|nr:hypothetical protein TWF594_009431 [Orbilia oligospora]